MNQILQTEDLKSSKKNNSKKNINNANQDNNNYYNQSPQINYAPNSYNGNYNNINNMNNVNNMKKKKPAKTGGSKKMGIESIIKVFAICMIIFGLGLVGRSSYAISQSAKLKASQKIPEVSISRRGNVLNLSVKSEIPLRSVGFCWNGEDYQYSSAKQQKVFNMNIKVIDGEDNKLNIAVVDMSNKKSTYHEKYSKEPDTTKPEVYITNEDPKIKIIVTDDTALDHVTYKYGDDQEERVEADSNDPTKLEIYIDNVDTTQKTLVVEAVDKSQNHYEVSQEVRGTINKPKIEVTQEQNSNLFKIKITDEYNLQKVVIYLNDRRFDTSEDVVSLDKKEFEAKVPISRGDMLRIEAYNINEKMATETFNF